MYVSVINMEKPTFSLLEKNYQFLSTLYVSSASPTTVELYEERNSHDKVILKKLDKSRMFSAYQFESAYRELQIHQSLKHPNIVELYETKETSTEFLILMEFISHHNYFTERIEMVTYIQNNKPFNLKSDGNIEKLRSFSYDILRGVEYMHSKGIIHMDLKPANLMVKTEVSANEYPLVKVADFGLSRSVQSDGFCVIEKRCGTDKYIAPEVRDGASIGVVSDMWAYGMILHLLTVGYLPYATKWTPGQELKFIQRNWKKYENTGLVELISMCLQIDPNKRLTSEEALMHHWFSCEV